jgi:hypothetical protein
MRQKKLFVYLVAGFFIITSAFVVQFIYPHRAESPALNETDTEVSPALQFEESYQEDGNREVERESARSDGEQEEIRASSAEEICVSEKVRLYEESHHDKGSLLVSFDGGMSLDDASVILEARGLTHSTRDGLKEAFLDNPWLEVIVPEGEEFLWICRLEEHPSIRGAIPNTFINLRQ